MSDTFPTAAEQAAADAKAKAATYPAKAAAPVDVRTNPAAYSANVSAEVKAAEAKAKAVIDAAKAVPGPFPLTTDDKFILKDLNGDGVFDAIVVERHDRVAEAKVKAERERHADFYAAITSARHAATVANAGRSASDVTVAEDLAEAKARVSWKGPIPPADVVKAAAKVADAKEQAAIEAELAKMPRK